MIVNLFKKYKNARKKSMEIHEIRRLYFIIDYSTKKMLDEKKTHKVDYFISCVNEVKNSLKKKSELRFLPNKYRNEIQELDIKNLYDAKKMSNLLKQAFTGRAIPMTIPDLISHEHYYTGFKVR